MEFEELLKTCADNNSFTIYTSFCKAQRILMRSYEPVCSISGGSDSDIVIDLIHKTDEDGKVTYFWIAAEPFPQQAELEAKEDRLKTVTDELNQAAIEAKKNAPKRQKTCYFERAKMKREAMRVAKQPRKSKSKGLDKKKQGLE